MKKYLVIIYTALFCTICWSQNIKTEIFKSEELNDNRELRVYIPPSYEIDSTKFYPLTIVLDAEYLFDTYVGNAILFAKKEEAPEQIIVGINQNLNKERYRDCSYQPNNGYPTESAEQFYRFIRAELLIHFEDNYRTSPFKTIVGNTLTANFTNYFLIEDFPSFNAFINISPYYAIDMPNLINKKTINSKDENIYYYLSNCNLNSAKRKKLIELSNKFLTENTNPKFVFQYDYFETKTKTSVIGQSMAKAMAFIFSLYSPISKQEFETNVQHLSPPDAIAYLEKKYINIEYLFGSNIKIRERDIYAIEGIIIDKENGDFLRDFGKMIRDLYPESSLSEYYIGMYYETGKKYKLAIKHYKNGYMKLPEGDPQADGFYENVERVMSKMNGTFIEPTIDNN